MTLIALDNDEESEWIAGVADVEAIGGAAVEDADAVVEVEIDVDAVVVAVIVELRGLIACPQTQKPYTDGAERTSTV